MTTAPYAPAGGAGAEPLDARAQLRRLAEIAAELGAASLRADIEAFALRIEEGRFHVACLGQFKRGKSTLLNALVGRAVLPVGVVPVTTVPTILQYGVDAAARVRFTSGAAASVPLDELEAYVSEARNPRNVRGVEVVEVFLPSPLLRDGLCLVDMPGVGSVFEENTAATRAFVPQIDAALAVLGVDPPLSGDELHVIAAAARHIARLIVVLNKVDRYTAAECNEAKRFAESILAEQLGHSVGPIMEVSAMERLAGDRPARDWDRLVDALHALRAGARQALVHAALERGVTRLAERCIREIGEMNAALYRPLDESDRRVEAIQTQVGHLAHESLLLGFRMQHMARDAQREATERRDRLPGESGSAAADELAQSLAASRTRFGPARRRDAYRLAREIAEHRSAAWCADERRASEERYRDITERLMEEARVFLSRAPELAALGVRDLSGELESADDIRAAGRARGVPGATLAAPNRRLQWLVDALGRPSRVHRAIAHDATRYLRELLEQAARAGDDDIAARLEESQRRLMRAVHAALEAAYETADRATARARAVHAQGEAVYRNEVEHLAALQREASALRTGSTTRVSPHSRRSSTPHRADPPEGPTDT